MARYEIGITSVAAATGATYCTLHTGSSQRMTLLELQIFTNAATASQIGLIRASNTPVATTSQLGQAQDPNAPASGTNADTAWSTAPTVGSIYLRKVSLPATAGAGVIWTWPLGLIVSVSAWLVLWNTGASTASALSVTAVWDE